MRAEVGLPVTQRFVDVVVSIIEQRFAEFGIENVLSEDVTVDVGQDGGQPPVLHAGLVPIVLTDADLAAIRQATQGGVPDE